MIDWQGTIWAIDIVARETMLFAAAGILIGGIDDIAIDLIYFALVAWRRVARRNFRPPTLADFPVEACSGRIAVFVAALWLWPKRRTASLPLPQGVPENA